MRGFIKFNKGVMGMPLPWKLWLVLLVSANMVVPLIYLARLEAQVVLGVFVASILLFSVLTSLVGFTRLLGLGHILWFPLIYFLWTRLAEVPADDFYGVWMRALMVLNAASLVIDVIDVVRYVRGDREETVTGLSGGAEQPGGVAPGCARAAPA